MNTRFLFTVDHPIFKNHMVHGRSLLPGMAYIDFLYQIFQDKGFDFREMELRNLSLFKPLTLSENEALLLDIHCEPDGSDSWRVQATGRTRRNGKPEDEPTQYIAAEMVRREPVRFEKTIDPSEFEKAAVRTHDLAELYARARERELVHRGMMAAEGKIRDTGQSLLIDVVPNRETRDISDQFIFHPTLIDASGVGSAAWMFSMLGEEKRLYLPLFFESFSASHPIQNRCLTLIQKTDVRVEKELMHQTWEFYDGSGGQVGLLKGFINKLVREPGLVNPNRAAETSVVVAETPSEPADQTERPNRHIESFLQKILARHLSKSVDKLPPEIGYYELGLDSSRLLKIVDELGREIGAELSPILLFEHTNIAELAAWLREHHGAYFGQSVQAGADKPAATAPSRDRSQILPKPGSSDIAVIGLAGRYPDAADIREFWENLKAGKDSIREIPADRWVWRDLAGIRSASGKEMCKWGGFLEGADRFDPLFFNMSPSHAEVTDPQERLFLQTCWEAMEDAGYTPANLAPARGPAKRRRVGVFAGVMHKDYSLLGLDALSRENVFPVSLNCAQIANRVSYTFNFHGPSMAVDTVCSSSLTALYLAMESIRNGDSEVAFAGGVNLCLHPTKYISYGIADMHASDGRCRAFGEGGDGYVPAEGVGVVLLKPLDRAVADRDHIYAVIKGGGVNHVGAVSGISVPSPVAQAELIADCLDRTGVDPRTISYLEAHGTGTSLGDPIEMQGLLKAFRRFTPDRQFCAIGSVKSNIGHAEAAAGISGLTKVVLQLAHKTLVPSLHAKTLNPYIDFASSPFYVQQKTEPWPRPVVLENGHGTEVPRRAGLSSTGAGGANAHVILEEYVAPRPQPLPSDRIPVVILLSAKDEDRLVARARDLRDFIQESFDREKADQENLPVSKRLCAILAKILEIGPEEIEPGQPLSEYGMDPFQTEAFRGAVQEEFAFRTEEGLVMSDSPAGLARRLEDRTGSDDPGRAQTSAARLLDMAYTLQVGREAMAARFAAVVDSHEDLAGKLENFIRGVSHPAIHHGLVKRVDGNLAVFRPDRAMRAEIDGWILQKSWDELAALWVKGLVFDWETLYGAYKASRINLPAYPFSGARYWIPGTEEKPNPANRFVSLPDHAQKPDEDSGSQWLFFKETWVPRTYPERIDWRHCLLSNRDKRICVLYTDERDKDALRELLTQMARAAGLSSGLSISASHMGELGPSTFAEPPDVVFVLGPKQEKQEHDLPATDDLEHVFLLSQSLMKQAWADRVRIYYLFEDNAGRPRPDLEALSGFIASAMKEHEQHVWRLIGWRAGGAGPTGHQFLLREWLTSEQEKTPGFAFVRHDRGKTRIRRLEETRLSQSPDPYFRSDRAYLIAGGLGPVGVLLCREIAKRFGSRLIILSRGALDNRRREQCRELEDLGARVHYYPVDIADRAALEKVMASIEKEIGEIHGVIHLARLVEDAPIIGKSWPSFQRVIRAKVQGTLNLDALTANEPLDFFMLFSSIGAYGTRGSSDYGYAAAFQNAFAHYRNRLRAEGKRPGLTVSQAWGPWTVDTYRPKNRDENMAAMGLGLIRIEDAFPWLHAGCAWEAGVLGMTAVLDRETVRRGMGLDGREPDLPRSESLDQRLSAWERRRARGGTVAIEEINAVLTEDEVGRLAPSSIERLHAILYPEPVELLTAESPSNGSRDTAEIIRETLSEVLKLGQVDENQSFQNYGLDSISGMQFSNRLEKKLKREVQPQWLLEFTTVQTLSRYLTGDGNTNPPG